MPIITKQQFQQALQRAVKMDSTMTGERFAVIARRNGYDVEGLPSQVVSQAPQGMTQPPMPAPPQPMAPSQAMPEPPQDLPPMLAAHQPGTAAYPPPPGPFQQAIAGQVHQLPVYGAMALAAAAPEAAPLGLMLGGAAGRAIQQQIPQEWGGTPAAGPQALLEQGQSGATQLALGQGPQEVLNSAKGLADRLMATSLGKYSRDALKTARTALENRVGPGFRNKAVKQVADLIDRQRGSVNRLLQRAKADGRWHDPTELIKGADDVMNDPAVTDAERSTIARWNDELLGDKTAIPPDNLNRIRQRYDTEAKMLHEAAAEKNYIGPAERLRAQWAKGIADRARAMLQDTEQYGRHAVPGLKAEQGTLGDLIELNKAIKGMAKGVKGKVLPYAPAAGAGTLGYLATPGNFHHRLAGGAAAAAAFSPQGLSNMALLLSNPEIGPLLARLGQSGAAVVDASKANQP